MTFAIIYLYFFIFSSHFTSYSHCYEWFNNNNSYHSLSIKEFSSKVTRRWITVLKRDLNELKIWLAKLLFKNYTILKGSNYYEKWNNNIFNNNIASNISMQLFTGIPANKIYNLMYYGLQVYLQKWKYVLENNFLRKKLLYKIIAETMILLAI